MALFALQDFDTEEEKCSSSDCHSIKQPKSKGSDKRKLVEFGADEKMKNLMFLFGLYLRVSYILSTVSTTLSLIFNVIKALINIHIFS